MREKKKRIMECAIKLFSEKGFEKTSTREIAREAGVAEGTIFSYFNTKNDLLLAVYDCCLIVVDDLIVTETIQNLKNNNKEKSDKEFIKHLIKNRIKMLENNLPLVKIFFAEFDRHEELQEKFFEHIACKNIKIVTDFLQEGIDEGRFRKYDPGLIIKNLAGLVYIHFLQQQVKPDLFPQYSGEEQLELMIDIFLEGLVKK